MRAPPWGPPRHTWTRGVPLRVPEHRLDALSGAGEPARTRTQHEGPRAFNQARPSSTAAPFTSTTRPSTRGCGPRASAGCADSWLKMEQNLSEGAAPWPAPAYLEAWPPLRNPECSPGRLGASCVVSKPALNRPQHDGSSAFNQAPSCCSPRSATLPPGWSSTFPIKRGRFPIKRGRFPIKCGRL